MRRFLLLLWVMALPAPLWSSGAETPSVTAVPSPDATPQRSLRPVLRTLLEEEPVPYPTLGISITAPANTQLLGPHETPEAENYLFPWMKTPLGRIDLALAPAMSASLPETLEALFTKAHQRLQEHGTMLLPVGKPELRTLALIPMIRQQYENRWHFQVIRYYFVTPNGRLAFLHLHGTREMHSLEHLLSEKLTKLEARPQKP